MPRLLLAAALMALCVDAHAGPILLTADEIEDGGAGLATTTAFRTDLTPAAFSHKEQATYTGVGVAGGRTDGEIDTDEIIRIDFTTAVTIDVLNLMLLFNGPEYDDTEERAQVTAYGPTMDDPMGHSMVRTLTSAATGGSTNPGPDEEYLHLGLEFPTPAGQGTDEGEAALWTWGNPFGTMLVTRLEFTAVSNLPPSMDACPNGGGCTNDSDYSIYRVGYTPAPPSEVPEPATLGLLGAGLLGIWSAKRRHSRGAHDQR